MLETFIVFFWTIVVFKFIIIDSVFESNNDEKLRKGKEEIDIKIELEKYKKTQRHKNGL